MIQCRHAPSYRCRWCRPVLSRVRQPELPAGDLFLRPWTDADADALQAAFADPAIRRWHARTVESRPEAAEMIARYHLDSQAETAAHWAIADPAVLGRVALRAIDLAEGTAEIAYWVTPAARGRGTAVQAAIALSPWALDDLGLHRLDLQHAVANTASCRVAARAGYAYEGTRRSARLAYRRLARHAPARPDSGRRLIAGPDRSTTARSE